MNIFEKATKIDLKFESKRGLLTPQDLWKLPLTSRSSDSLDSIGLEVMKKLQENSTLSLVSTVSSKNETDELRLEIIKHIISVKQSEIQLKEQQEVQRTKLKKIDDLIDSKKDEKLSNMTLEELELEKQKVSSIF